MDAVLFLSGTTIVECDGNVRLARRSFRFFVFACLSGAAQASKKAPQRRTAKTLE